MKETILCQFNNPASTEVHLVPSETAFSLYSQIVHTVVYATYRSAMGLLAPEHKNSALLALRQAVPPYHRTSNERAN